MDRLATNINEDWAKERIDNMLASNDPERYTQCSILISRLYTSYRITYQDKCRLHDYMRSSSMDNATL